MTAIEIENLGKRFRLGVGAGGYDTLREVLARAIRPQAGERREFWALRGLNLDIAQGEVLGIVGHNGAGKSTLLRILAGITLPSEGFARTRGAVGSLLDVGTGFHPELTGRENVFLSGAVMGMRRSEVHARFDEIVEFSGVERFLDTPVKRYSEGMRLRLGFAVAAHLEPPIVVVDEVLAVGDSAFREKCMGRMAEMGKRDRTVLFVSHDLGAITQLCTRAVWLEQGSIQLDGPAREVVSAYLSRSVASGLLDLEFDDDPGAEVAVLRITVRDPVSGQVIESPMRGESFTIEFVVDVRESIPDLSADVIVIDELGAVIIDDNIGDRGFAGKFSREPGRFVLSATIPPLLRAGRYTVRCWIGSEYEDRFEQDLLTMRITPRADDPQHFSDRNRAVQPDVHWAVRQEPTM